jgi:gamma-glutamylcyclotransferase (GGCT)/AIG2-like uncharacterized protein YtfP
MDISMRAVGKDANTLYFAYGSNMSEEQMKVRCHDHELVGVARLDGYQFRLNSRGVATIVPDAKTEVYGIVWSISEDDEAKLDVYEGVAKGVYRKGRIQVVLAEGDRAEALVYVAADSTPGNTWGEYLNKIIKAAKQHGFPRKYIRELEEWTKLKRVYSEKELEYIARLTTEGIDRTRAEWYLNSMQTWTQDDYRAYTEYHRTILGYKDDEDYFWWTDRR